MSIILKKLISNSKDEKSFVATEDLIKFAKDRYHLLDTKDEESFVRVICVVDVCYSCGHHQLYYCNYNDDYRIQEISFSIVLLILISMLILLKYISVSTARTMQNVVNPALNKES